MLAVLQRAFDQSPSLFLELHQPTKRKVEVHHAFGVDPVLRVDWRVALARNLAAQTVSASGGGQPWMLVDDAAVGPAEENFAIGAALAGLAVWLEDWGRGPVLYRQVRVGENNREFTIYKFRSMRNDAEEDGVPRWANKNDTRVTRVGAFIRKIRLDELPQIFNILKGDMSFVGPRPERPEFVQELGIKYPYYSERHRMKPGLTGWAQISYEYGDSQEDAYRKLEYDLYYVKNYSIFLDLLIILHTIQVVITGKGAH